MKTHNTPQAAWEWGRDIVLVAALLAGLLSAAARGEDTAPPAERAIPAELVGEWMHGTLSPTTFWDKQTGVYQGNGRSMASYLILNADGTYKEYVYIEMRMYNMVTTVWTTLEGTVKVEGKSIQFTPTRGHYKTAGTRTIDRPIEESELPEKARTCTWRLEKSERDGKQHLIFPFDDGSRFDYTPQKTEADASR